MTTKTITFCDICNPHCLQPADRRRYPREESSGRRASDHCAWVEGGPEEIAAQGWIVTSRNKHICPRCYLHHKDAVFSL